MQHFPLKRFTLIALFALGAQAGCGSDGGGSSPKDAGADSAADLPPDAIDAGGSGDEVDSGPCVPKGCDEQGFECGIADDGCGNELDCTGVKTCESPQFCGADNRCGCTPLTCESLSTVAGGTVCGATEDGCGNPIDCGGCTGLGGDGWQCNEAADICECTPKTSANACAGRACGAVADGCGGGDVSCGNCAAGRECTDAGQCTCQAPDASYATLACRGKTCGTVTVNGCTFNCGGACASQCAGGDNCATGSCGCAAGAQCRPSDGQCCVPSTEAALCASADCGTSVTDPCTGAVYTCGCAAGTTCVDKLYLGGSSKNSCVANDRAALLGGYIVRAHSFENFVVGLNRAETVSRVRIVQAAGGALQLQDTGCVATTVSSDGNTRSVANAYPGVPSQVANVAQSSASAFERVLPTNPETTGFLPGMPDFCNGTSRAPTRVAADFAAYPRTVDPAHITPGSGSEKPWIAPDTAKHTCTCPLTSEVCTAATITPACLPKRVTSSTPSPDCRLNDVDEDGRPGFTAIANADVVATAVTVSKTGWSNGLVDTLGAHTARGISDPAVTKFAQTTTSCSGILCGLLGGTNTPCRAEFNRVQFARLSPESDKGFSCSAFYKGQAVASVAAATKWSEVSGAILQTEIDSYFNGTKSPLPACGAGNTCPEGMLCKAGSCYPKTSQGVCTTTAECGPGWECLTSNRVVPGACWPVASSCK